MSMHLLEAFIDVCAERIADSDLPILRKRSLIHSVYEMESYGDCGFTQLRAIDKLLECQYTFLFSKKEMYDYNDRREFYDDFEGIPYENGDVYAYWSEDHPEKNGMVCVDSGTAAWKEMMSGGHIVGDGAVPLESISFYDALKQISKLLSDKNNKELSMLEAELSLISGGLYTCAALTGIYQALNEDDFKDIFGISKIELESKLFG